MPEFIEFCDDDVIKHQMQVAHFRGSATFFNEGTFEPDLQVKSIYVLAERAS